MKRLTHHLTVLIILQVAIVILLVVMTIFSYQNRSSGGASRDTAEEVVSGESREALTDRIAALEQALGFRDPEVDALRNDFEREEATARTLEERMANLGRTPNRMPPPPDRNAFLDDAEPVRNPAPAAELTEAQRRIADLEPVARVVSFDSDWNLCEVTPNPTITLQKGQLFDIRHSYEIIARVSVTRPEGQSAIVDIVPGTLVQGAVPAPGDELVPVLDSQD